MRSQPEGKTTKTTFTSRRTCSLSADVKLEPRFTAECRKLHGCGLFTGLDFCSRSVVAMGDTTRKAQQTSGFDVS